jgi:uncharacterized protein (TIGR03067 family)
MKKLPAVLAVSGLVVAGLAAGGDGDREKLQGKWKRTSPQVGATVPLVGSDPTTYGRFIIAVNGPGKMEIQGDRLVAPLATGKVEVKLTLDPAKEPRTIDARNDKGKLVFQGIYVVGKDTLRLCVSGHGERPKRFENTKRTPLIEFKRQ